MPSVGRDGFGQSVDAAPGYPTEPVSAEVQDDRPDILVGSSGGCLPILAIVAVISALVVYVF